MDDIHLLRGSGKFKQQFEARVVVLRNTRNVRAPKHQTDHAAARECAHNSLFNQRNVN